MKKLFLIILTLLAFSAQASNPFDSTTKLLKQLDTLLNSNYPWGHMRYYKGINPRGEDCTVKGYYHYPYFYFGIEGEEDGDILPASWRVKEYEYLRVDLFNGKKGNIKKTKLSNGMILASEDLFQGHYTKEEVIMIWDKNEVIKEASNYRLVIEKYGTPEEVITFKVKRTCGQLRPKYPEQWD
jgi:hypothetical protein